jgi:hypothetical protein
MVAISRTITEKLKYMRTRLPHQSHDAMWLAHPHKRLAGVSNVSYTRDSVRR